MASQPISLLTVPEFLDWERIAISKHEYLDGEIVAMAGASLDHLLIVRNISRILSAQLKGTRCSEFSSDLRVAVHPDRLICYPDLTVACAPYEMLRGAPDTLVNPVFLIEVLSPSTRAADRGVKLPFYREIPSLSGYLFVEQSFLSVEYGRRTSASVWDVQLFSSPGGVIEVPAIGARLPVEEIYADVRFATN